MAIAELGEWCLIIEMILRVLLAMSLANSVVSGSTLNVGLIGHYTFEGSANDVGNSGNNLQVNGSSLFISTGHNGGQALRTNGDRSVWYSGGGYLTPSFIINNSSVSAVSFSFWTRNEASGGPYSPGHTEEAYIEMGFADNQPHIKLLTRALGSSGNIGIQTHVMNGVWQGQDSPTFSFSDWKMITLTVSDTEYAAYLNGIEFDRRGIDGALLPTPNIRFGSHTWNTGSESSARMDVEWDDMRIYDRALSSAEVSSLYTLESVPEASALSLLAVGLGGLAMMRRRRS